MEVFFEASCAAYRRLNRHSRNAPLGDPVHDGTALPESARSVMIRPGKAGPQPARRRTAVRRTSEARANAARADQGLLADPGYPFTRLMVPSLII